MTREGTSGGLGLLRQRDLRRMFVAYVVTYTGTAMAPIAMAFGVLELSGSASQASYVIAAPTVASIGVLLIGGVLADRTSRQRMIVVAETLSMIVQLTIAILFLTGNATVPILAALMLVNGMAMALNVPAANGLIVQLVPRKDLQALNALLGIARNSAVTGGAALGGFLVATFGAGVTLLIDAATFGVSAVLIYSLNPREQTRAEKASLLTELKLGWIEFTSHTWLWVIVLQFSILVAVHESVVGLIGPAVTRDEMGGATDWGMIAAGFGVGTLIGGLISLRLNPTYPMRFGMYLCFTFCLLEIGLSYPLPIGWIVIAALIQGAAGQMFAVLWYTTLQRRVPEQMLSRVSAYDHLGSIALAPLGIVLGGYLYDQLGFRTTLWLTVVAVLVPTVAAFCVRDVRNMKSAAAE